MYFIHALPVFGILGIEKSDQSAALRALLRRATAVGICSQDSVERIELNIADASKERFTSQCVASHGP